MYNESFRNPQYGLNRGKRKASRDIGYEAQVMLVTSLKLAS